MILILPIHKHNICFHLFVFSVSFFNALSFSEEGSFNTLVNLFLGIFDASIIGIVFKKMDS